MRDGPGARRREALVRLAWPASRIGDALIELARHASLVGPDAHLGTPPLGGGDSGGESDGGERVTTRWLVAAATSLGFDVEAVYASFADAEVMLARASPALVGDGDGRVWALLRTARGRAWLVGPDGVVVAVRLRELAAAVIDAAARRAGLDREVESSLADIGVPARHRARVRHELLAQQMGGQPACRAYLLAPGRERSLRDDLRAERVGSRLALVLAAHAAFAAIWVASWYLLGRATLSGRLDRGWVGGWALCLGSLIALRAVVSYGMSEAALRFGIVLKRRLVLGAIQRHRDETIGEGTGRALAYVFESSALEAAGLRGLVAVLLAALELLYAPVILALGAGGLLHAMALVGWTGAMIWIAAGAVRARIRWTEARTRETDQLVEALLGQRTRRVQGDEELIARIEDGRLSGYVDLSRELDRRSLIAALLWARAWLVVGLLTLAPWYIWGAADPAAVAVSVGGILFAFQAYNRLGRGLDPLAAGVLAWRAIRPLSDAAARRPAPGTPEAVAARTPPEGSVLVAQDLSYRYPDRVEAVLEGASLVIARGERILLEGRSGAGKSTLAEILAGYRRPAAGSIALAGLDLETVGSAEWRRRIALVPQFHANHVFTGSLAFNLLLGRRWPPSDDDVECADAIARELGLDQLIDAMPGGLFQLVGQTGWRLSHGEASRIFVARALLQEPEVLIMDESLAALDPELLIRCAACVRQRADTLVLIAHP